MIKNHGAKKLGRTTAHSRALLRNMASSLFVHEKISTTVAKAKALRSFAEKLITQAKKGDHRQVRREIHDKAAYKKLFEVLAARYQDRNGGFTRVLRLGTRKGDNAPQGLIKLVQ